MNEALPTAPAPATTVERPTATPDRPTSAAAKIGVLLVNLGTPEAADAAAVRRYLKEFLTDARVIEDQGALWQLVLNGIILPVRPRRKARDYAKIWNHEKNESPLKTITRSQAEKLARALEPLGKHLVVDWAMRYGNPSIASTVGKLVAHGCDRVRRGFSCTHEDALSAVGAHRATLLQRHGLYRGSGILDRGGALPTRL